MNSVTPNLPTTVFSTVPSLSPPPHPAYGVESEPVHEPQSNEVNHQPAVTPLTDQQVHSRAFADLSIRTPQELLGMTFSPADNYLGGGLIAKGQGSAILGPGAVGKSMLSTQIAFSLVLGAPFLGLPVESADLKCLFLQAENSNFRLKTQLQSQLSVLSEEEKRRINAHIRIHTLEHAQDTELRLKGRRADAVARMLNQSKADVLFVDPLNAFAKGSLNTDDGMLETLHELTRLAKEANPDAAIVIIHHTRTDRKAHLDAVGAGRANYGRGSKALHGWSRGTMNIAAGHPEDSSRILIACGKNSNGPEFEALGAVRDPSTLLYEPDPNFDLDTWMLQMSDKKGGRNLATPERVAELVTDRSLSRKELVAALKEEYACGSTKAYDAILAAETRTILEGADRRFRAVKV